MTEKIIIIEDKESVLNQIKQITKNMQSIWQLVYFTSAREALTALSQEGGDIVISSMELDGVDTLAMLRLMSQKFSSVVRIIYTTDSDKMSTITAGMLAHQVIPYPFDPNIFLNTLQRTIHLHKTLENNKLASAVSHISDLPTLPELFVQLKKELSSPEASIKRVADIISRDVAMTAKILKFTNSAFFSLSREIVSLNQAISYIGIEILKALILHNKLFSQYESLESDYFSFSDFEIHSQSVARFARELVKKEKRSVRMAEEAFISGLLHDIGKLIFLKQEGFFKNVQYLMKKHSLTALEAEYKLLGTSHAEAGAYLLALWGFPDNIVEAIMFHHKPEKSHTSVFNVLTAIYIADAVINEKETGNSTLNENYLLLLDLTTNRTTWGKICSSIGVQ